MQEHPVSDRPYQDFSDAPVRVVPADSDARVRVVLADADPLARRTVRDVLQDAGLIVIGEASNDRDAIDLAFHYRPEIVLVDANLPSLGGVVTTRRILAGAPGVRVVVFSVAADPELGIAALRAGASGFLTKDIDLGVLPGAFAGVLNGETACSGSLVASLVDRLRALPEDGIGMRPVRSKLTPREWEVLDLLCEDASTDDIADRLVLSSETVRSHIKNIMRKLAVRSRADAVRCAGELRMPRSPARAGVSAPHVRPALLAG